MSSMIDQNLKISIFGESHSAQIGVVIDNLPAGIPIDMDKVGAFMARRAPKKETYSTARREADIPQVVSGLFEGHTTGTPLCPRPGQDTPTTPVICAITARMTTGAADTFPAG